MRMESYSGGLVGANWKTQYLSALHLPQTSNSLPAGNFAAAIAPNPQLRAIGIVGGGNSAQALASFLAYRGYAVYMFLRDPKKAQAMREKGRIQAQGLLNGSFAIEQVTIDAKAICECDTIFVATITSAYADVAKVLAPSLKPGTEIILFSGKFCGVLEFEQALRRYGACDVLVCETDALFAGRIQADQSIWIRGFKNWTLFSAHSQSRTRECAKTMSEFFPGLEPAQNIVQRGLTDFGALAHTLTMIANMNTIDRGEPFLFYYEGLTKKTIALLEQLEAEFRSIASAYETTLIPMAELLNRYYGCDNKNGLLGAMQTVPNYRYSQAPASLDHRFISEDVACSLIPMQALARVAKLATPMIDSTINIASVLTGQDFCRQGRTLEKIGLANMSHGAICKAINE